MMARIVGRAAAAVARVLIISLLVAAQSAGRAARFHQGGQSWLLRATACTVVAALLIVAISPVHADGAEIAYIANDGRTIHLVQSDGSADRQIVSTPADMHIDYVAWSPDGEAFGYTTSTVATATAPRLYLYNMTTGRTNELRTSIAPIAPSSEPIAFFPDGKHLLTGGDNTSPPGTCQRPALAIDTSTGTATSVATLDCGVIGLHMATDGALIATTCGGGGPQTCGVWNIALPSADSTRLTEASTGDPANWLSGVVSPDDQTLAYIAVHPRGSSAPSDLVLANRDGSNPDVVSRGIFGSVAFSPDGAQLALTKLQSAEIEAPEDVWVLSVNGDDAHQIAAGRQPTWRPAQSGGAGTLGSTSPPSTTPGAQSPGNASGASPPQAVPSGVSPPPGAAVQIGGQCFQVTGSADGSRLSFACDDGSGYILDFTGQTVSMFDPANPDAGITQGPWPMTSVGGGIAWRWVDPEGHTCQFASTVHVTTIDCTSGA